MRVKTKYGIIDTEHDILAIEFANDNERINFAKNLIDNFVPKPGKRKTCIAPDGTDVSEQKRFMNLGKGDINCDDLWKSFKKHRPSYGDVILLKPAPEQSRCIRLITYDKTTEWLHGDAWAPVEQELFKDEKAIATFLHDISSSDVNFLLELIQMTSGTWKGNKRTFNKKRDEIIAKLNKVLGEE